MTISILTIGDEICSGYIVNTNAAWIAAECSREGWRTIAHSAVGDENSTIRSEAERLLALSDVVLLTGGLGATHDDVTKYALAEMTGDALALHEPTLERLRGFMRERGRELSERNATQAMLPSHCEPLPNDKGLAPGMLFRLERGGKERWAISMPGVPAEMKHIMETSVLPRLRERSAGDPVTMSKTLLTNGITESNLADLLGDPQAFIEGQELAFLPSQKGVALRLTITAPNRAAGAILLERLESSIIARAGKYVYGAESDSMELVVGNLLAEQNKTLAVAESCTGGLLGAAITSIAGSSAYFLGGAQCYNNESKITLAGVKPETLARHGAVSREVAEELAAGVRERLGADIGVSITGVAGPGGGTPEKPVGTVWIGLSSADGTEARNFIFTNDRTANRERSVSTALLLIYEALRK